MWTTARRLLLTGALVAGIALPAAPALAQQPDLEDVPGLTTQPPPSLRDEPTPTPTPDEPDPTPTPSATPAQPGATATPDTTPTAASGGGDLPNTGSDAQTLALAGLSLLLLGASLRLQVVLRDGRV